VKLAKSLKIAGEAVMATDAAATAAPQQAPYSLCDDEPPAPAPLGNDETSDLC
jgi:hypothetical protein